MIVRRRWSSALTFVLLVGVMSFFADFTYEGARSVVGPFLASLGAGALAIAVISGLGELLGYTLRLVSGRVSDRSGRLWQITIAGYVVQMGSVPLLALAQTWQAAALLIILERIGKATRNPPRDVMLSHAAGEVGYGKAFGLHEALDQFGALFGPLSVAAVLAFTRGGYRMAFATLAIPATITLVLLGVARLMYPRPRDLERSPPDVQAGRFPGRFWLYLVAAALVGAGFADYPLIAFHFQQAKTVPPAAIPLFYAAAMATSGAGSLIFGHLYDRWGLGILVPLTVASAWFAPLVFFGDFWLALLGACLWGLGMGVHESIIPAAVGTMVAPGQRATAYGLFTAGYGTAWFVGSALLGALYGVALGALVTVSITLELAAIPLLLRVRRLG